MRKFSLWLTVLLLLLQIPLVAGCSPQKQRNVYQISAQFSENTLEATMQFTFYNNQETALSSLSFNLYGNAYREGAEYPPLTASNASAYYNGKSYGQMEILSVSPCKGWEVGGEDENILRVDLEKELFPAESVTVNIEYVLTLAQVEHRTGVAKRSVNLGNFYPVLCAYEEGKGFYECVYSSNGDPFYSDCADYTVTLTADSEYVVAASGKVISSSEKDGKRTATYKIEKARSFAFVLSKEFEMITDDSTGVNINYYYYDDAAPEKSLEYAVKSVKLFNEKYGNYVYPDYSVVQTRFIQGGMEFPALVMISDDLESAAYGEVIVHETAHQWWQTAVGNNEVEYGFLDEGLAEYSVVVFYENYPEYSYTRESLISSTEKTYKVFCSVYDKLFGDVDTTMLRALNEYSGEYEYVNIAYIKSCLMYDYLRTTIGDERFFKGLKNYYSQYCFKNADPYDIVGVFEKTGADTNGFFESFYDGKVII